MSSSSNMTTDRILINYLTISAFILSLLMSAKCLLAQEEYLMQEYPTQEVQTEKGRTIYGRVTSLEDKEALIGVKIKVKGSAIGTVTNIEGEYKLEIPSIMFVGGREVNLEIIYPGFVSKKVVISTEDEINIILKSKEYEAEETVVIGYGTEDRKVTSAAVSLITSQELTKTVSTRIEQALQGKAAGVTISQNSGSPGAELNVRIRGIGTPNNSDPLYVIDGVRAGGMDFINPSDIERIDILKDAASAAIYGVAAANGVILITTKQGKKGTFEVNYSGYYGFQQLERKVSLLNATEYSTLYGYDPPTVETDWQNAIIGSAPITNHVINFSGGGELMTYSVSGGYFKQGGIIGAPIQPEKSNYERFTFRSNVMGEIHERFRVKANVSLTSFNRRELPENNDITAIIPTLLNYSPAVPIYDADDPYYDSRVASDLSRNPVSKILTHQEKWEQFKTFDAVTLEYEPIDNLVISVMHNIDYSTAQRKVFQPEYNFNTQDRRIGNTLTEEKYEWYNWTNQGTVSYKATIFDDHTISGLAGYSLFETNYQFLVGSNTGVETNDFDAANLGIATGGVAGSTTRAEKNSRSILSFFGRLNYVFQEKYAITSNLRVDGSSRFGANNRFAVLPSVSASWVISDEEFFAGAKDVLNYMKLRASWGMNGNEEIGNYKFFPQIRIGQKYVVGDSVLTESNGSTITDVVNEELRWETSSQLDVGLDLGFFENRLTLSIDYFYKLTNDVLVTVPIPGQVGLDPSEVNAGSVLNQGVEVEAVFRDVVGKLKYTISANISYFNNSVLSLGNGGQPILAGNLFHVQESVSKTAVGYPIASFFGRKVLGIFQNQFEVNEYVHESINDNGVNETTIIQPDAKPGDFKYQDANNDGKIDQNDNVYLGKPIPDVTASLAVNLEFMNFDFYVLLDASFGNSVYRGYVGYQWGPANQPSGINQAWKQEGDQSQFPVVSTRPTLGAHNPGSLKNSSFFVEDASFLKVRNIQLGYSIPKEIIGYTFISSIRFYASIQNLFTFTGYSGFDPEIGKVNRDNQLELGIDKGFYPSARTFTFGVEIKI